MRRPRLLDLFCGAGGAAVGYHRAGFDVVGVDIEPQPHYPFTFHQADALVFDLEGFDAVHASPPCQRWAPVTRWRGSADNHPDLIGPTRDRLTATAGPWVIENVRGAPIDGLVMLCGSGFGLAVQRHRYFETSWAWFELCSPCRHDGLLPFMHKGERAYADAMGCGWMTGREAREAIPPAYTEYIGGQLLARLGGDRVTDAAPSTPNFYLKQAVVGARNVRAWIHRYTKLHPEDPVPGEMEMEGNRVSWVAGVLDDLDHQLARAVESVDHHVPTAGSPNRLRVERQAEAQQGLNLHRLKMLDKVAVDLARWVSSARWSEGVKPGDLDRLESLVRQLAEHTNHLSAQAQEQDLER